MGILYPPPALLLPRWERSDGPAPYVYERAPKGNRCAWSCIWLIPNGEKFIRIAPEDWTNGAAELLSDAQLLAEIGDYKFSSGKADTEASELYDGFLTPSRDIWRKQAGRCVRRIRSSMLKEYIAEFGPMAETFNLREMILGPAQVPPPKRPGWDMLYLEAV